MPAHRIFTGSFEALESRLVQWITEAQAGNPLAPVAVLVGSNILASYLKVRIAARGRAVANTRFYTFADLVTALAAAYTPGDARPPLLRLGSAVLLDDALEEETPAAFAPVARFPGFRRAVLDTFRDLRDAGIAPAALDRAISGLSGLTAGRRSQLTSLSSLYRRHRERAQAFRDAADDYHRAAGAAAEAPARLGTSSLAVYGLYDVTGLQADVLHALKNVLALTYFVPYLNESASAFARPFLEARSKELEVPPELQPLPAGRSSLDRLAPRIFDAAGPGPALEDDGSFRMISAPGESRAAVEVIREVLRAVKDGVIAGFHEAAVILRRPEEEAPVLAEACRLRRIPFYLHGGSPFTERPLARAVLSIAGLEGKLYSRPAVLAAMELVEAALPEAASAAWNVPQWRSLVNDARFLAGLRSWDEGTEALCTEKGRTLRETEACNVLREDASEDARSPVSPDQARRQFEAAAALRSAWANLRQAASGWPAAHTWRGWSELLRNNLEPLLNQAEDWPDFSVVLDTLETLSGLSGLRGDPGAVTRARFARVLGEALEDLSHEEGTFQRRGINLLPAVAARGLRLPLVIIPGLIEGRFPARLRQDPLLLDAERMQTGRPSRLPLKSLRVDEDRLLFDMAVRAAERRVVLLTSRLDEASDRETIPSQFFLRCASAAAGCAVNLRELNPERVPGLVTVGLESTGPGAGRIAVDEGEIRLGLITASRSSSRSVLAALARLEPHLLQGPIAYDRARWTRRLTEFDGRILDRSLLPLVRRKLNEGSPQLSASRLEQYAKCPYLFFLSRVHGIEKWEEEEQLQGLDPLLRGEAVHRILEEFLRKDAEDFLGSKPHPALQDALNARARRILEGARPAGMPDLLWEIECENLLATLQNWLSFEKERSGTGFAAAFLERSFGSFSSADPVPPFRIDRGERAFEFRGRLDRIDVSRDGRRARVVDYKVGSLPPSMREGKRSLLMAGEKLQLAVYAGAISTMEDMKSVERVEGEYLYLQPGRREVVSCGYSDGEMSQALGRLPEILEVVSRGMETGVFFARASGRLRPEGHCRWCDYLSICGKDRVRRQALKSSDPEVSGFERLAEIDGAPAEDEE